MLVDLNWTKDKFDRHFDSKSHRKWEEDAEKNGFAQASLAEAVILSADTEANKLSKKRDAGTSCHRC